MDFVTSCKERGVCAGLSFVHLLLPCQRRARLGKRSDRQGPPKDARPRIYTHTRTNAPRARLICTRAHALKRAIERVVKRRWAWRRRSRGNTHTHTHTCTHARFLDLSPGESYHVFVWAIDVFSRLMHWLVLIPRTRDFNKLTARILGEFHLAPPYISKSSLVSFFFLFFSICTLHLSVYPMLNAR